MRRSSGGPATAGLLLTCAATLACSVGEDGPAPPPFGDFEIIQCVTSNGLTPWQAMKLHNNGDALLRRLDGCTRDGLVTAGMPVNNSQFALLPATRLLEEAGDSDRTAIPFLWG